MCLASTEKALMCTEASHNVLCYCTRGTLVYIVHDVSAPPLCMCSVTVIMEHPSLVPSRIFLWGWGWCRVLIEKRTAVGTKLEAPCQTHTQDYHVARQISIIGVTIDSIGPSIY